MSLPFEINEHCLLLAKSLARHKEQWLDAQVKKHLPPVVYRLIIEQRHLDFCSKYFVRHGFHQRYHMGSGKTDFCKGDTVLATYVPPEFKFPNKVTYPFFQ